MCMNFETPQAIILGSNIHDTTMCAAASRISTTTGTALSLFNKSLNNPNNEKLVRAVLSSGHQSIMEHCTFNMAFNNVSVFVEQFMIEFRLASFTVQSRRYVDFSNVGYFCPTTWNKCAHAEYNIHINNLFNTYGNLVQLGIPKEDARFVLPYCFHSNFYCSCNARELLHIICTMIYGRGHFFDELVSLGQSLAKQFDVYFPGEIERNVKKYQSKNNFSPISETNIFENIANHATLKQMSVSILSKSSIQYSDICNAALFNNSIDPHVTTWSHDQIFHTRARELELVNITYKIENISLAAITHLVRHRMQSVLIPNILSSLYSYNYILPKSIESNSEAQQIYINAFETNLRVIKKLVGLNIPAYDLVYLALSGNTMNTITSMNGREMMHFFQLRTCNRAQWEIRGIAISMLQQARNIYPEIFNQVGPNCYMSGRCPEGTKTCGQHEQVKKYFSNFAE